MIESLSLVCLSLILGFLVVPRLIDIKSWEVATEVNSMVDFFRASVVLSHSKWLKEERPMQVSFGPTAEENSRQYLKMNTLGWPIDVVEQPISSQRLNENCRKMWNIFVEKRLFNQNITEILIKESIETIAKNCQYSIANEFLMNYETKDGSVILGKIS